METKQFLAALEQIAAEKGISKESIIETVQMAIAAAYKKEKNLQGHKIKVKLDPKTGKTKVYEEKTVVTEASLKKEDKNFNPKKQLLLKEAKKLKKNVKIGDVIKIPLGSGVDYGRIAAQTAKQVIIQKIKETERETIFQEYKEREGEIISGVVQRQEKGAVFLDLGRTNGILPPQEQIPGETYHPGSRIRALLLKVEKESRGPVIFLSRNRPEFLLGLLKLEVPEIDTGSIEVKAIAREPGARSKIAVISKEEGVDPIGACVGQKGVRISTVIQELGGENIDVILWDENPEKFIANALSPAKILEVSVRKKFKEAKVLVSEDQLSLAIGKSGRNVRLAAKLTGWKIDVVAKGTKTKTKKQTSP